MTDEERQEHQRQLDVEREKIRRLEEECAKLREQAAIMRNQLQTYQPLAEQWWREHGPSKEECEAILKEMLAHPEELVDMEDVLREMGIEIKDQDKRDHAA
jgi:hypothetical protein